MKDDNFLVTTDHDHDNYRSYPPIVGFTIICDLCGKLAFVKTVTRVAKGEPDASPAS